VKQSPGRENKARDYVAGGVEVVRRWGTYQKKTGWGRRSHEIAEKGVVQRQVERPTGSKAREPGKLCFVVACRKGQVGMGERKSRITG